MRNNYLSKHSALRISEDGHFETINERRIELIPHILNTPHLVSSTGALSAALNASASTRRVSLGAMMPSSHSRAVA
jgi:hypothetical protein